MLASAGVGRDQGWPMSIAPTLNSCARAPLVMSTATTTKMAVVINTKISLAMVVITVALPIRALDGLIFREAIGRDYGRCSPRLRPPPDVIAATTQERERAERTTSSRT